MFGLSVGEIILLLIVGIVVVGPRNLPTVMRTMGQWVSKLRRMSHELRSQSGIDDLIRQEGLEREIHELRSLSRMNVVETLITPAAAGAAPQKTAPASVKALESARIQPLREREYPLIGCDAGEAMPDDAMPYAPDEVEHKPAEDEEPPPVVPTSFAATTEPSQKDSP